MERMQQRLKQGSEIGIQWKSGTYETDVRKRGNSINCLKTEEEGGGYVSQSQLCKEDKNRI